MQDIINSIKDCLQQSTNIYNEDKFNIFIDKYNNVNTFPADLTSNRFDKNGKTLNNSV